MNNFERLPMDEARPRPLLIAIFVLCVATVIFCLWQVRDRQQTTLATTTKSAPAVMKTNRPGDWLKRQQRVVVPTTSVPLDTTSTPSLPTNSATDTNVPPGFKQVRITLVGTGFETKPQTKQQAK